MQLTQERHLIENSSLLLLKSFSIWTFTLTVCLLVVGFPMVVIFSAVCAILSIALQSVLPVSAVLLVVGTIAGAHAAGILVVSAVLTARGIHPHEVSWLNWLNDKPNNCEPPVFAACPLTCNLQR